MMRGAILSLAFLSSVPALADDPIRRLSGYHFDDAQWYFQPVHDESTGLVDAVIAIAKPGAVIGDNLNTVMFLRNGDEFEAWSWRNTTRARAVYSAKMILGISDEDDALWQLDEELPWLDENAIRPPTPYEAGMLTDDPLFEPIMESDNPQALIDMLAENGYPVTANRPEGDGGESTEPCPEVEHRLLAMAHGTEWALTQPLTEETAGDISDHIAALFNCWPFTPCTPGATGPVGVATGWIPKNCVVTFINQDMVFNTAGATVSCNYEVRKFFTRSRSTPAQRSDCSKFICRQSQTGKAVSTISCTSWVPTGTPLPTCPGSPSCTSSPSGTCGATAPTITDDWGPPCI